jgi:hypothetical protein
MYPSIKEKDLGLARAPAYLDDMDAIHEGVQFTGRGSYGQQSARSG